MTTEAFKWGASQHLDLLELIEEYLKVSFEEGGSEQVKIVLANVAKVKGMTQELKMQA